MSSVDERVLEREAWDRLVAEKNEYQRRTGELTIRLALAEKVVAAARDMYRLMTTEPEGRGFKDDAELIASSYNPNDPRWAEEDRVRVALEVALAQFGSEKKQSGE